MITTQPWEGSTVPGAIRSCAFPRKVCDARVLNTPLLLQEALWDERDLLLDRSPFLLSPLFNQKKTHYSLVPCLDWYHMHLAR